MPDTETARQLPIDYPDPDNILEVEVMGRHLARIGSRVRHYPERYTASYPTATVTGFSISTTQHDVDHPGRPWIKVHVDFDRPDSGSSPLDVWDWDRTVLAEY